MCTYLTNTTAVSGSGLAGGGDEWFRVERAVVYFDHPQDAPVEHALCIDLGPAADPTRRVAVELDAPSARRLAETILATLDHPEALNLRQ
jgi:hypothetical protein